MGIQSDEALLQAYSFIEDGDLGQAKALLDEVYTANLDNKDLLFAVHSCTFWLNACEGLPKLEAFEQGESLIKQWKRFLVLIEQTESPSEKTIYTFSRRVFSMALAAYSKVYDERDQGLHAEVCRKIGFCHKKLGSYEVALKYLTEANRTVPNQAYILAEMADCYDLCGEAKSAKVIFREAFFIDPQKVEIVMLDSPLMKKLIEKVAERGYTGLALQEWIPVYGTLYGVFSIKRPLKSQEVGRLKQDIFTKENEMKDPANDASLITPRLLNMYFWLIDHYELSHDGGAKIHETLLQIKILDRDIYALYTGSL